MNPTLRKLTLTAHVIFSIGWLGAVVAYLAPAITTLTSSDLEIVRAAYLSMDLIGWNVIVPLSLASLVTGLVQSLGTEWGLFRHYWIAAKFFLTVFAVFVLLKHMPIVTRMARFAADPGFSLASLGSGRVKLVWHPALGLLVLLANTVLSIYKPWGMTPYGRRKQQERRKTVSVQERPTQPITPPIPAPVAVVANSSASFWAKVLGAHVAIALVLLFVALHLSGHVPHH
jgi:hypothetical protein